MSEDTKKRKRLPGQYPDRIHLAVAPEDTERVCWLANHWRTSIASAVRRAVAEACAREGKE